MRMIFLTDLPLSLALQIWNSVGTLTCSQARKKFHLRSQPLKWWIFRAFLFWEPRNGHLKASAVPPLVAGCRTFFRPEVRIYKRKQECKKTCFRPRKRSRKKKENTLSTKKNSQLRTPSLVYNLMYLCQ